MSIRSAADFLLKASEGGQLEEYLEAQEGTRGARLTALVELGSQQGFDFTEEDVLNLFRRAGAFAEEELADEVLEDVAGGTVIGPKFLTRWWSVIDEGSLYIGETEKNLRSIDPMR